MKGVYLSYNPPNNFSRQTHVDRSSITYGFLRVSLCGIVNQLFNISVTGSCEKAFFVFRDRLKVYLERLLVSWHLFRRNKMDIKSDDGYRLTTFVRFVSRDQFYPRRAQRIYLVCYE